MKYPINITVKDEVFMEIVRCLNGTYEKARQDVLSGNLDKPHLLDSKDVIAEFEKAEGRIPGEGLIAFMELITEQDNKAALQGWEDAMCSIKKHA